MGLRSDGGVTGIYPGARDTSFTDGCRAFFERQIETQRPQLILTLGAPVPELIANRAPSLRVTWGPLPRLADIDSRNVALVHDVHFPSAGGVTARIAALVPPSYRHANAKPRTFARRDGDMLTGSEAEIALITKRSVRLM